MPKQINENFQEVESDRDETYKPNKIANYLLKTLRGERIAAIFSIKNIQRLKGKFKLNYGGEEMFLLIKNFTYVGNPHPENRKRIQVNLNEEEASLLHQKRLFLIGIYHFKKVEVCGFYQVKEKQTRKWHNSSVMWINTEDLKVALTKGHEKKTDKLGIIHLFKSLESCLFHMFQSKRSEIKESILSPKEQLEKEEESKIKEISNSRLRKEEKEQWVRSKSRIGQSDFRDKILDEFDGRCIITGISKEELLIASHIKPWRKCDYKQALDKNNGLLLIPNYDKLFDLGFISFNDKGEMLVSDQISGANRKLFGFKKLMVIDIKISEERKKYLKWHRINVFEKCKS